jgi:parallel beta-helix repeat protein
MGFSEATKSFIIELRYEDGGIAGVPMIDRDLLPYRLGRERKRSSRVLILAILIAVLMLGATAGVMIQIVNNRSETPVRIPARIAYTSHNPISITGNGGFTNASGVVWGSGTASDPYIIRGWEITAGVSDFAAVFISSSDAFFRLEDCHLNHLDGNAIELDYVSNGMIINNTCTESLNGICLAESNSITIVNNTLTNNDYHGIFMSASNWNVILSNNCSYNSYYGIWLGVSDHNTISDNSCSFHTTKGFEMNSGIYLDSSSSNTLTNNSCLNNSWNGIGISNSDGNIIADNACLGNSLHGIRVTSSNSNFLGYNNCSNNLHGNMTNGEEAGILLDGSSWNTLSDNICLDDDTSGIAIRGSTHNILTNNTCSDNTLAGIYMDLLNEAAQWNTLANNTCRDNPYGIMLWQYSSNNTLVSNNCSENSIYGIYLAYSRDNILTNNTCSYNLGYGLYVTNGDSSIPNYISRNNTIWNNTLIHNNGATDTYDANHIQAYDDGTNNSWNSADGYGNWWSDWQSPDNVPPYGIVDLPYNISGNAGAKDHYPLTTPQAPIPEFGAMPLIVIAFVVAVVLTMGARPRKPQ